MISRFRLLIKTGTVKDSFVSMVGLGFSALAGTLFTILVARNLGPDHFGVFSSIWAIVQIFAAIGDFGLSSALINYLPKYKEERNSVASTIFRLQIFLSLFLILIIFLLSVFNSSIVPGSEKLSFYLVAALVFADIVATYAISLLRAERNFIRATVIQVIEAVVRVALIGFLLLNHLTSTNTAIIISTISTVISFLYGLWGQFGLIFRQVKPFSTKKIINYIKWLAFSKIFSVATGRLDIILLNILAGSFAAGIFSAASRITLLFTLIISSLGSVVGPRFSEFENCSQVFNYFKKLLLLILGVSICMGLTIVVAQPIITVVFGDKYTDAILVFQTLVVAMIPFLFSVATTSPLIYSFNQPRFFSIISIFQVVITITIELLTIPLWGVYSPVIAIGISNLFVLIATSIRLRSNFKNQCPIQR